MRLLRDADTQALTALATRRHQVQTMVVAERNRLGTATSAVRPHIEAHIAWLTQQLAALDRQLRQTRRQSPVWRAQDDLLCSVPGVGAQLSLTLLAGLHAQFRPFHPQRACQHPAPGRSKVSYARQSGRAWRDWTRSPSTRANSRCRQRTWDWMRRYTRRRGGHANWCRAAVSCWTGWRRRVTTPASLRSWWPLGQTGWHARGATGAYHPLIYKGPGVGRIAPTQNYPCQEGPGVSPAYSAAGSSRRSGT